MGEQAVTEAPNRQGGFLRPVVQNVGRRGIPQEEKTVIQQHHRREPGEETRFFEWMHFAVGQLQLVRERKLRARRFQVRRQLRHLAVEGKLRAAVARSQPVIVPPTRQPLKKLDAREHQRLTVEPPASVHFGEPLDKPPVIGREKFLLVRGARGQLDNFTDAAALFAGSRTGQHQFDSEPV